MQFTVDENGLPILDQFSEEGFVDSGGGSARTAGLTVKTVKPKSNAISGGFTGSLLRRDRSYRLGRSRVGEKVRRLKTSLGQVMCREWSRKNNMM